MRWPLERFTESRHFSECDIKYRLVFLSFATIVTETAAQTVINLVMFKVSLYNDTADIYRSDPDLVDSLN